MKVCYLNTNDCKMYGGMSMTYYCTLFDSNFLTRGLAMYNSLVRSGSAFKLFIFPFDDIALHILNKLHLDSVEIISLEDFETEKLREVKKTRSKGEYCWTCTPFIIGYIMDKFPLIDFITYIDADLYFFGNPEDLLLEFRNSNADVLLTEHRYTPEYDQSETSGIYCVQFMSFRNNDNGMNVVKWWQEKCADWCFARFEDNKFGDQKYLDDWLERFGGVYVLQHIGGGVAPWNIQQYKCTQGPCIDDIEVVFYHFHALQWLENDRFDLGRYRLSADVKRYIYYPYIEELKRCLDIVRNCYLKTFDKGIINNENNDNIWSFIKKLRSKIGRKKRGTYNVIQK